MLLLFGVAHLVSCSPLKAIARRPHNGTSCMQIEDSEDALDKCIVTFFCCSVSQTGADRAESVCNMAARHAPVPRVLAITVVLNHRTVQESGNMCVCVCLLKVSLSKKMAKWAL